MRTDAHAPISCLREMNSSSHGLLNAELNSPRYLGFDLDTVKMLMSIFVSVL